MSDIEELERRIAAALDRIRSGVDGLEAPAPAPDAPEPAAPEADDGEVQSLREALAAEKAAGAQLEERLKALKQTYEDRINALEEQLSEYEAEVGQTRLLIRKVRKSNHQLRDVSQRLRDETADGVAGPETINQSIQAELESLRAVRELDRQELDTLLAQLEPHVKEGADA